MKIKEPFVSIVICTHNRAKTLEKYILNSIQKLNYNNFEVIVVDDASTDNTNAVLKSYQNKIKNLKLIRNNKMKGLCYVRNLGIKYSQGEIIAFTDDDCYVDKNWIKELVKTYKKNSKIVCVGGKTYIGNSKKTFNSKGKIFGCNMSIKKEIFDKFQFDTNLYFNKCSHYDETEFIERLKEYDLKVNYTDKAKVNHYILPADFRKNSQIGGPLNLIYMHAKKVVLKYYYHIILKYMFSLFFSKTSPSEDQKILYPELIQLKIPYRISYEIVNGLCQLKMVYRKKYPKIENIIKIPWIFFILLIEIPFKSRKKL